MTSWLRRGAGRRLSVSTLRASAGALTGACVLAVSLGAPVPASAQKNAPAGAAAAPPVRLLLRHEALTKQPGAEVVQNTAFGLRANTTSEILTYVVNDGAAEETVTVQLLVDGTPVAPQKVTVKANSYALVPWPKPAAGPADKPVPLAELAGVVSVRLADAKGEPYKEADDKPWVKGIRLFVERPSAYLGASMAFFPVTKDRKKNVLTARVTAADTFRGQPCPVELVLDPSRIQGLVPDQKKVGAYAGFVRRVGAAAPPLYLSAEDVQLRGEVRKGLVFLRADGFDRAFAFQTDFPTFGNPNTPQRDDNPRVWISAPRAWDPRKPLHAALQADNLRDPETSRLVLQVIRLVPTLTPEGKEEDRETAGAWGEFRGEKNVRLFGGSAGPAGGLLVRSEVNDWAPDLDFRGLHGKITLRLLVRDDKDQAVKVGDKDLSDEKPIILDDTPPENAELIAVAKAKPVVRGKPLLLEARAEDPESGISEVTFFAGPPAPDGTVPPKAIFEKVDKAPEKGKAWAGKLLVPADQKGPFVAAVRFVNGVGLATTVELPSVEVIDAPGVWTAPPPALKKASITGIVVEGDRPQKGLTVTLVNAVGKAVGSVETAADGSFAFRDLDPGTYQVIAVKSASMTQGTETVKLAQGADKTGLQIKLYR
jgi:hypothetical protein